MLTHGQGRRAARACALAAIVVGGLVPAAANAATPVTACGTHITVAGEYELTQNMTCSGDGNTAGVHLDASNVTLNMNGFTITGSQIAVSIGVFGGDFIGGTLVANNSRVVGPGTVTGAGTAFAYGSWATNSGFTGVTATDSNTGFALQAPNAAPGMFVRNSAMTGNTNGLVASSGHSEVSGNNCSNNTRGAGTHYGLLFASNSDNNDVFGNTCNGNTYGITLGQGSLGDLIHSNTGLNNTAFDSLDQNADCGTNQWYANNFGTASPTCANASPNSCTITGTDGDDTLTGTAGNDVICGGAGRDTIKGLGGNDILNGGDGVDTLDGGLGADVINGDAGRDQVRYPLSKVGIILDMSSANGANDGAPGEGDTVGDDIEVAVGSNLADVIYGNAANNTVFGKDGDDTIHGRGGLDLLFGNEGFDQLVGDDDSQADTLDCGPDGGTPAAGPEDTTAGCTPVELV